ncbi:MAG: hypothetical protein JO103_02915 [Candidatus Eremiobacteraeota bacterium]|nr:hypothetical protein [Candidatus Eremiobacteraeota bacterium]
MSWADAYRGRRVLVTGHTGFKGAWLALWLKELGAELFGYALPPPTEPSLYAEARVGELLIGEALADVRERLRPTGPLGEQIEGLILRCEFSDQRVIQAADHARFDREQIDRIHALDREIVETADRVRGITSAEELGPVLDEAARALDERFGALSAESPGSTATAS